MHRRGFITGIAGILAAGVAPAVIGSGILMPARKLWTPPLLQYTVGEPITMTEIIRHGMEEYRREYIRCFRRDKSSDVFFRNGLREYWGSNIPILPTERSPTLPVPK